MTEVRNSRKVRWFVALAALATSLGAGAVTTTRASTESAEYQVFYSPIRPNDVYCSGECGTGSCCIIG
jgi:hypothetical protein